MTGSGLTVTVKEVVPPVHPFIVAVMPTMATNGTEPPLVPVKAGIIPLPEVPNPTSLLLVQLKVGLPPVAEVEKVKPAWFVPGQRVWLLCASTAGVGLTVMVKLMGIPSQPDPPCEKCGVTVMVAAMGFVPGLVPVNVPMFPVPDAASPISG